MAASGTSRRRVLGGIAVGVTAGLAGCIPEDRREDPMDPTTSTPDARTSSWLMPDEGEEHERTWMAFGATEAIWSADLLEEVRHNLADIALTIAEFEPVSMLVRPAEMSLARKLMGSDIDLVEAELDDLWVRDTGPTFVTGTEGIAGVDLNFNGWGGHQEHRHDARVAQLITDLADTPRRTTDLVLEGGALEVDGRGTAIITESCVLNENRNPGWTTAQVEEELERLLGIRSVIWLPGIAGRDITDGHTDFYARFAGPGLVVAGLDNDPQSYDYEVTRTHREILEEATDVTGRTLEVVTLPGPDTVRRAFDDEDFAAGYINFFLCNGGVIAPQFGDRRADRAAKRTLQDLFPGREVVQVAIDGIAAGGGGIHCATQQQPLAP